MALIEKKPGTRYLQNTWNSTCSWRIRLAMAYKKIQFEYVGIKLQQSEDTAPEYINVNPSGVPTLTEPDGKVFTQSAAIMEYLDEAYPDTPALLPKDPAARALCRALAQEIISGIQPLQNFTVAVSHIVCRKTWPWEKGDLQIGVKQVGPRIGEFVHMKYLKDIIIEKLWGFENLMKRTAGKFCCGDIFTQADAALIPQVGASHYSFGVDIRQFPTIARVMKNLIELDFVLATEPGACPDLVGPKYPIAEVLSEPHNYKGE